MIFVLLVLAVVSLFVILKLLTKPIKLLVKLLLNALIGFVVLFLLNFFGDPLGIYIELNFLHALVVGVLGIPGIILLLIIG